MTGPPPPHHPPTHFPQQPGQGQFVHGQYGQDNHNSNFMTTQPPPMNAPVVSSGPRPMMPMPGFPQQQQQQQQQQHSSHFAPHPTSPQNLMPQSHPPTNQPHQPHPPTFNHPQIGQNAPLEHTSRPIHQPGTMGSMFGGFQAPSASTQAPPTHGLLGNAPDMDIFRRPPMSPINPPVPSDFIRCTMNKVPKTQALLTKTKMPLGVTISPYPKSTKVSVPVINGVIVRCRRCRSYLNPYVEQIEQGARWRCNLCLLINEYPPSFDVDPKTQQYVERSSKHELNSPVYEFVAPVEYMIRAPQPPAFVFVIDVSYLAISTGMVATASKIILDCLDRLPNETGLSRIAIIAVDSAIHFFKLGLSTPEPQTLVVPDLKDIVIPCRVSDLLVSINECRVNIETILQRLSALFGTCPKASVAFGSGLNAACTLIAPIGGKVIGLLSSLPTVGEGALQQREDSRLYGTPKEVTLLQSASSFYKMLATEATKNQLAVDLFLFPSAYIDVASVSCVSRYTGGQVFMYPGFNAGRAEDAVKFAADFSKFLETEFGMEAVLRIRATQGVSIPTYHGSFFFRSSDLLAIPNVAQDHSYSAQLTLDDALPVHMVGIQAAFLHTTCSGERRIRVINAAFPVSEDARELVQWIDTGAMVDLMSKVSIDKIQSGKIEDGRDYLIGKLCEILSFYRQAYGIGQNQQLQVCDSLRSLPILVLGALKSLAIRCTANVPVDIRSFFMNTIRCGSVNDNVYLFAPYLLPIHLLPETAGLPEQQQHQQQGCGEIVLPPSLNAGSDRIERNGVYLLDDGRELVFYVGAGANADMCIQLFGQPYHQLTGGKIMLPRPEGPLAKRIGNIIYKLASLHRNTPFVFLVKEDSEPGLRAVFFSRLIEDRGASDSLPSYQQFLSTIRDKSNS